MKVKVAVPFLRIFTKSFWTKEKFLLVDFSVINIYCIFLILDSFAHTTQPRSKLKNQYSGGPL